MLKSYLIGLLLRPQLRRLLRGKEFRIFLAQPRWFEDEAERVVYGSNIDCVNLPLDYIVILGMRIFLELYRSVRARKEKKRQTTKSTEALQVQRGFLNSDRKMIMTFAELSVMGLIGIIMGIGYYSSKNLIERDRLQAKLNFLLTIEPCHYWTSRQSKTLIIWNLWSGRASTDTTYRRSLQE